MYLETIQTRHGGELVEGNEREEEEEEEGGGREEGRTPGLHGCVKFSYG